MERRDFFRSFAGFLKNAAIAAPLIAFARAALAGIKKTVLSAGTKMSALINKNPAHLDTRHLHIIPLDAFETMGLTDHVTDLKRWRLEIVGSVDRPLRLTHDELHKMDPVVREVLMICPGVFANHGRWQGVSILDLLNLAGVSKKVTHIVVRGPEGEREKKQRFSIDDIHNAKLFLAYSVNGKPLPQKHGFPLRLVAEGYFGFDWIKYVHRIEAIIG